MKYPWYVEKNCSNCRWFNKSFSLTNPKDMCDNIERKSFWALKTSHCELFEPKQTRYKDEQVKESRFDFELQRILIIKEEVKNVRIKM